MIYQIFNPDGSITFTTRKPLPREKYRIFTGSKNFSIVAPSVKSHSEFIHFIQLAAKTFDINPNLIKSIIKAESNFNPYAKSNKGALGLMQLMPETVAFVKIKDPFNPKENIFGGTKYLRYLLDKYNQNLILSLAAYNAGPKAVDRYGGVPPFPETKDFVKKVLKFYNYYTNLG